MQSLKSIATLTVCSLLIIGCATAEQVMANGPTRTYATTHSPEAVRDCVLARSHMTSASPFKDGWRLSNTANPNVAQLAEIERVGEGTVVKVYAGAMQRTLIVHIEHCV